MVAKLTVVFFILVCLLVGSYLILLPWMNIGLGDWNDNYLLAFVSDKTNLPVLRRAVTSNWFRGAVTGLGILNLIIAVWEVLHFRQSVAMLDGGQQLRPQARQTDAPHIENQDE